MTSLDHQMPNPNLARSSWTHRLDINNREIIDHWLIIQMVIQ